ncbi:substrate-binding domain-containing protein [Pseudarthrobacter oxydans]|uniref:substrate-binding domain-containing protein n=1 Tax=Pseudarthrobacter oxydans TaxID=1671 RepID=UPI003ECCE56B
MEVPRDLSVVGYDDLPLAAWVAPSLTTINQPLSEMAETAVRMILGMARGTDPHPRSIETGYGTGCPREQWPRAPEDLGRQGCGPDSHSEPRACAGTFPPDGQRTGPDHCDPADGGYGRFETDPCVSHHKYLGLVRALP